MGVTWLGQATSPYTESGYCYKIGMPEGQNYRPEEKRRLSGWEPGGSLERDGLSRIPGPGREPGLSGSGSRRGLQGSRARAWGPRSE